MNEKTLSAVIENIIEMTAFVDEIMEAADVPMKQAIAIDIAIDEIFSNICKFAYGKDGGDTTIRVEVKDNPKAVRVTFIDSGIPYNPIETKDPDTDLSAEERPIGGLGIYMVKQSMDELSYEYSNNQNVFTITKCFE